MSEIDEKMRFTIHNEEGEEVECEVLFTFDSEETNKSYMVYTDNTTDEEGNARVYASTYTSNNSAMVLAPIETEKEYSIIETILDTLQEKVGCDEEESSSAESDIIIWMSKMNSLIDSTEESQESVLFHCISEITRKLMNGDIYEYTELVFELLVKAQKKLTFPYKSYINLGMEAYKQKNYALAELAFTEGEVNNNLAYLIRRGEVKDASKYGEKKVVELLKDAVHSKDPFSMVNMALFWALNIGTDDGWRLADGIMHNLPKCNLQSVCDWWADVANDGDDEGYLVHYWLLKHGRILCSPLGSQELIRTRLRFLMHNMPAYI